MQKFDLGIIFLSRLGDMVQLSVLLKNLENLSKRIQVLLICFKQDYEMLHFLLKVDQVYTLDKNDINIPNFIEFCQNTTFNCAVNLSFSPLSGTLLHWVQSFSKLGPSQNKQIQIPDLYSQYIYSSVMEGPLNPFHLMDLFAKIIGIQLDHSHLSQDVFHLSPIIIISTQTSNLKKQWKEIQWIEFIYHLLHNNPTHQIYFAGSSQDFSTYENISQHELLKNLRSRIILDYIGMDLQNWIPIFHSYPLFIGHDSFFFTFC